MRRSKDLSLWPALCYHLSVPIPSNTAAFSWLFPPRCQVLSRSVSHLLFVKRSWNLFSEPTSLFDLSTPCSTDRHFSMCFSLSVLFPEVNKNWGLYCKFHKGRTSAGVCCKISCMVRETLSEQYIPWVLSTLLSQRFLYILFCFLNSLVSAPGSWECWWS